MNYLELMVSVKPLLLVFIATRFKSQMNDPAGPRKMGGVGDLSGMEQDGCNVSKVDGCVDFRGVKVRVSRWFCPLALSALGKFRPQMMAVQLLRAVPQGLDLEMPN